MASVAKLTIRVYSSRGASRVTYSTSGKYVSFTTAGLSNDLTRLPVLPTAELAAFWSDVLAIVQGDVT